MRQLKLPLEIEKLIDISDPVYTFCEVMDHIDLSRYFVEKGYKTGRPRCDAQKLIKVILFAFMENGICSLREIEKLLKKKRENGLLPLNCVTNFCLLTKKEIV